MSDTPLDAMKDAAATSTEQQSTKEAEHLREVYFTEGEMLPWKSRWFRVHLNAETKRVELELVKPTGAATKRAEREQRWRKQHPRSLRGAGALFGSAASRPASRSTTAG